MEQVAINKSGESGEGIAEFIHEFRAGGYPVTRVAEAVCRHCAGRAFRVAVDDDEGCAQRVCVACGAAAFIADSADYWAEADPGECECPCGGGEFAVSVGFALLDDEEVRWISVGLRCLTDNALGVYADWKIDYTPTKHLLDQA